MSSCLLKLLFILPFVVFSLPVSANAPKVGRSAAAKYFQRNPSSEESASSNYSTSESSLGSGEHYLSFGGGLFTKSNSYSWGQNGKEINAAKWGLDMSYKLSTYNSLLDNSLRVSYQEYEPLGLNASKLSFLYGVTLPDANSRFPLYFGAALGGGVFLTQIPNESPLTLDYQLYLGMRLFDVFERTGFYLEGGLKNHLQLTADGQLSGTYVSTGAVFAF